MSSTSSSSSSFASILVAVLLAFGTQIADVRGDDTHGKSVNECVLCEKTPCECDQLVLGDNNRLSIKRLILSLLGRGHLSSRSSESEHIACQDCRRCRYSCPKKHKIFKVLGDLIKKSGCSRENEEKVLRNLLVKLIDPALCERYPCESYCDPQVQKVLRAILKKASGCNCSDCPCDCILEPLRENHNDYQYWFRTTKESLRKEITCRPAKRPERGKSENNTKTNNTNAARTIEDEDQVSNQCPRKKRPKRSKPPCKTCRKPDSLICPRYVTDDCATTTSDSHFSVCADCDNCKIATAKRKNFPIAIICDDCGSIGFPFVGFTRTGFPVRPSPKRVGIKIRANFLQINDLRPVQPVTKALPNNPFRPGCNRSKKRRKKCTSR